MAGRSSEAGHRWGAARLLGAVPGVSRARAGQLASMTLALPPHCPAFRRGERLDLGENVPSSPRRSSAAGSLRLHTSPCTHNPVYGQPPLTQRTDPGQPAASQQQHAAAGNPGGSKSDFGFVTSQPWGAAEQQPPTGGRLKASRLHEPGKGAGTQAGQMDGFMRLGGWLAGGRGGKGGWVAGGRGGTGGWRAGGRAGGRVA